MNSPPDPGSPISTESSGTPPAEVEESNFQSGTGPSSYLANLTSHISTAFGVNSSSSKRRLPTGSGFSGSSARDPKSRKRGEAARSGNTLQWEGTKEPSGGKKEKDELIDNALVEYLRKEIGDPFQEPGFKH